MLKLFLIVALLLVGAAALAILRARSAGGKSGVYYH